MSIAAPPLLFGELSPCPTQLSPSQIAQYQRDGFITFESVLSPTEIEAAKASGLRIVGQAGTNLIELLPHFLQDRRPA